MTLKPHHVTCPFFRGLHWHKFLYLESKLIDISKHITLDKRNFNTWGEGIADLLVLTGNAMDTFFKDISNCPNFKDNSSPLKDRKNMNIQDYQKIFEDYYELSKNQVTMQFGLGESTILIPFEGFAEEIPAWWNAYNSTKHQFYSKLPDANLGNVTSCLSGLFVLNALHLCSSCYMAFNGNILPRTSTSPYIVVHELLRSKIGTTRWGSPYNIITKVFKFTYRIDESLDVHSPELLDVEEWKKELAARESTPIAH